MKIRIEAWTQYKFPSLKMPVLVENSLIIWIGFKIRSFVDLHRRNVVLKPDVSRKTDRLEDIPSSTTKIRVFENLNDETWYNNWHPTSSQSFPVFLEWT